MAIICEFPREDGSRGKTLCFRIGQVGCGLLTFWAYSKVYISFGGLLLFIDGPYKKLTPLRIDYVYLLLKK